MQRGYSVKEQTAVFNSQNIPIRILTLMHTGFVSEIKPIVRGQLTF